MDALGHDFGGTAKAALIGHTVAGGVHIGRHIVRVHPHDIAQGAVTLQRQVLLVVVHMEDRLCGIGHAPDDRNADLHRVAEAVVDLLAGVIQGHHLEGDLLAGQLSGLGAAAAACLELGVFPVVHVSALAQAGTCGRVDGGAEGVHPVKALSFQGADVIAEQGKHQRFLWLEDPQTAEHKDARDHIHDGHDQQRHTQNVVFQFHLEHGQHKGSDRRHIARQRQQQDGHAVFLRLQDLFFHSRVPPCRIRKCFFLIS